MIIALSIAAVLVAFVFIWRGVDVRAVLLITALLIGLMAGQVDVVFRKTAETLADAKFLLPICSAMGFAFVVRVTGCIDALVRILVRPIARAPRALLPGGSSVAFVVNMAIPSQSSTLAAVGPIVVALMARMRTHAVEAGAALVYGASVGGALLNPGLAEVAAVAKLTAQPTPTVVVRLALPVLVAFAAGTCVLLLLRLRHEHGEDHADLPQSAASALPSAPESRREFAKALLPPLPVLWLLLGHPSLPTHTWMVRSMPAGLEVFTAMVACSALVIAVAARDRAAAIRSVFEGMGFAFTHVITIIAVSAGTAKALDAAGVLGAFVDFAAGNPLAVLGVAFALAFVLAILSGSGTASSVALISAIGARAPELGVDPLVLGGVIVIAAEAGRTTSPVAAVLLFGSSLVNVPPRTLVLRLGLPCLVAAAAGAIAHLLGS